ncbi:hypothetical protein [Saccharopolyspora sp. SCSIO 74807]|uniref:hypothetical protein n=1 Tax=Saccharopolyspora sp. SCSIO 74807 TaxID=3118084 RepID=UPI0030D6215D
MNRRALPYRSPSQDLVTPEAWRMSTQDGDVPLRTELANWDYLMDLDLRRTVRVEVDAVRSQSGLGADSRLMLSAVWTSSGSNLRGPGHRVPLEGPGTREVELLVPLRGTDLGGTLLLDTALVLAHCGEAPSLASPRRAGSVLWSDRHEVRLQGDAPQFPIAVIDFARTSFSGDAAWHLQIGDNLEGAAMGSLLLLVNEQNAAAVAAVGRAERPGETDRLVLSAIRADVTRTMLEHALSSEDFYDGAAFTDETLGAALQALYRRLFPETSIEEMRRRREQYPNFFASDVQHAVKLFEVPS